MKTGEKLISNTVYIFLSWFFASLFSFAFWVIIGKTLNPPEYGIIATSISLITFAYYFSTEGIVSALKKLIPETLKKEGVEGVQSLVRVSIKAIIVLIMVISLLLFAFSNHLSALLKVPRTVILINIFSIASIIIYGFLGSILYGFQRMKRYFVTDFFQFLIRMIVSATLIFLGFSYFGPLIAVLIGLFLISLFRFESDWFKKSSSSNPTKVLYDYAFPAFISTAALALILNSQYIILTAIKSVETTGIFAVAFTLTSVIATLSGVLTMALFPIMSELSVDRGTKGKRGYLVGLILRYSMLLTLPLSMLFMLFPGYAVLLYSKSEYLPSASFFPILIPAALLYGTGTIFLTNIYATGKPKTHRNIMLVTALTFISISLPLTNYFSGIGLSFAYLVSMSLLFSLSVIYLKKLVEVKFFITDISKILFSSFLITTILFMLKPFIHNVFILFLTSIPIGFTYLISLFLIKFFRIEDVRILEFMGEKIPILGRYLLAIANFLRVRVE